MPSAVNFLDLLPEIGAGIFGIEFGDFAQEFLSALVARRGNRDFDFHYLVATFAVVNRRGDAFFAEAQFLAGLCAGRYAEQGAAVNRRHLNLGPQSGLARSDWDCKVDVVGLAMKDRMLADTNDHVQIARGAAPSSGVAFSGQANALTIASAGLDAHFQRLGAADSAVAAAGRASRDVLACPIAAWAGHVELHAAAGLRDLAGAVALRTDAWLLKVALAVALRAGVLARDVEAHDAAANGGPERDIDLVLEVRAGFRSLLGGSRAAAVPAKHAAENIAEAATTATGLPAALRAFEEIREIEAAEIEGDALAAGCSGLSAGNTAKTSRSGWSATSVGLGGCGIDVVGIKAELVVDLALLGIAEDVVRFGDSLEFFFGSFVAGIDVRVIFAREFAEGLADLVRRGVLFYPQNAVIIFLCSWCHTTNR